MGILYSFEQDVVGEEERSLRVSNGVRGEVTVC